MNKENTELINTLNDYIKNSKEKKITHYIITVSRDGENPPRSLISFYTQKEALEAYDKYEDAGFAKQYLTVSLYEPSGEINTKILRRNHAGEPSFVKKNYVETAMALREVKDKLSKQDYENLCIKILTSFATDNWRFDIDRFLKQVEIERKI